LTTKSKSTSTDWTGDSNTLKVICELTNTESELCNNQPMLDMIKGIAEEHGLDWRVMLAISYKESHIGTRFVPTMECKNSNNW
jgi:hypothetical protein